MNAIQTLFVFGTPLAGALLALWGLTTVWRVDRALAAGLTDTLRALNRLQFDLVETPERHEQLRGLVIEAEGVFPALEHAWVQFEESLVQVDGQPQAPRSAREFFESKQLRASQGAIVSGTMAQTSLSGLPTMLSTLGVLGAVGILGAALLPALSEGVGTVERAQELSSVFLRSAGWAAVPVVLLLSLRLGVRVAIETWQGDLEDSTEALVLWLDRHYRGVSSVQLLARLLARAGEAGTGPLPLGGSLEGAGGD